MCVDSFWDRDRKILHFKFLSDDSDLKQKKRIKDTSENKYATDKNAIKDRIHGPSDLSGPKQDLKRFKTLNCVVHGKRQFSESGQGTELLREN